MKILKFRPGLIKAILAREKVTTWRLFDEKDISQGDKLSFVNWETGEEFARGTVISVTQKRFEDLKYEDYDGHEEFGSEEEMFRTYSLYYKQPVNKNTTLKIIKFKIA